MKKRLKTLFYGMSHEHAPGKIATLRKLADDFEVVAIADDTARHSPSCSLTRPAIGSCPSQRR